jgi:hypothetical protein
VLITLVLLNFGHQVLVGPKLFFKYCSLIWYLHFVVYLYRVAVKQVLSIILLKKSNINLKNDHFGTDANAISG